MSDSTESGTNVGKPLGSGQGRQGGPIPIWHSRRYRERQARNRASGAARYQAGRFDDAALLREKRELADRLFDLCERADGAVRRRGGDISGELDRIAELSFIVSYWDSETPAEAGVVRPLERLGESRDYLAAMLLASEIGGLASVPERRSPGLEDPEA